MTTKPRMTAGTASRMNSHCQAARPPQSPRRRIWLEINEPVTMEIGIAVMKMPMMRER